MIPHGCSGLWTSESEGRSLGSCLSNTARLSVRAYRDRKANNYWCWWTYTRRSWAKSQRFFFTKNWFSINIALFYKQDWCWPKTGQLVSKTVSKTPEVDQGFSIIFNSVQKSNFCTTILIKLHPLPIARTSLICAPPPGIPRVGLPPKLFHRSFHPLGIEGSSCNRIKGPVIIYGRGGPGGKSGELQKYFDV